MNKVAIITGAGGGLGRTTANFFDSEGASIIVNDIDNTCKHTAEIIKSRGGEASAIVADVTKSSEVQRMVDQALKKYGKIDILIHSAGIEMQNEKIIEQTKDIWNSYIDNNLKSFFLCCKHVIPHMLERSKGLIINIENIDSIDFFSGLNIEKTCYPASQAGLIMVNKSKTFGNIQLTRILLPTYLSRYKMQHYKTTPDGIIDQYERELRHTKIAKLVLSLAKDEIPVLQRPIIY